MESAVERDGPISSLTEGCTARLPLGVTESDSCGAIIAQRTDSREGLMTGILKITVGVAALLVAFMVGWLTSSTGAGQGVPVASLSELEREFSEQMRDVVLEGNFTIEGVDSGDRRPERYEISQVTKLDDRRWRFDARVTYGNVDVTLPVVVPVVWADGTPMVSITDFAIPGLGDEFGARVVFYDSRYAGTWDHGEYGGLMYGTISSTASN